MWLTVAYLGDYTRSATLEVGADGNVLVIQAESSVKELVDGVVSDINARTCLEVTYGAEGPIVVDKESKDYDFALRLELKRRNLSVVAESSYYAGRSGA